MKLLISFDPNQDLIYLGAQIFGPAGFENAYLALDTGAGFTMIRSDILRTIGYNVDALPQSVSIVTASKPEPAKALVVEKLEALDQTLKDFFIVCHDLPPESGVDGVLGLNFLRHFDTEIRYSDNTLALTPLLPF
jgi:predicted aspartyl protease